jgi:hypothetical protein
MSAADLPHLPRLVEACVRAGVETLTVCTLPADLRLAPAAEAGRMVDALVEALRGLPDACIRLEGRRFYLPRRLSALEQPWRDGFDLRVAVDYAGRASLLHESGGDASLLLLPRDLEPGNLLRWQFARALPVCVDWQALDALQIASVIARPVIGRTPRLIAAR